MVKPGWQNHPHSRSIFPVPGPNETLMYINHWMSLIKECTHLQTDNLHVPDIEMFFHSFVKDNSSPKSIKIQLTIDTGTWNGITFFINLILL